MPFDDELKFDKLYPDTKVNYLVCDATNLPFDSNSVDTAISYFGIANMEDKIEDGIQEVNRILKKEGKFFKKIAKKVLTFGLPGVIIAKRSRKAGSARTTKGDARCTL